MRVRNNKLINFILETSQIILVFLGVYSSLMCFCTSMELTLDRWILMIVLFASAVLFYGLFTVLETFRHGKVYGILGITVFYALIIIRFQGVLKKGVLTIANDFLKEFMHYTESNLDLLAYTDTETASVRFCTTLVVALVGVYFITIISAFFYRRRRSAVFVACTAPFAALPLLVGKLGYFSNLFTYLIVAVAIIGTRHMKTDATDRRMRQKLSIILMAIGLVVGGISYAYMPPQRYDGGKRKINQVRNSVMALTSWSSDEVSEWVRSYFNGDTIDYGKIGKKNEVTYSGRTILKVSGDINVNHGLYLKGYVGDVYEKNRWSSLNKNSQYAEELAALEKAGLAPDKWHVRLRNELGDTETSGVSNVWKEGKLRIRNLGFGYGNYLVPYEPAGSFKAEDSGRTTIDVLGIDYVVDYYTLYPHVMRRDFWSQKYSLGNAIFWDSTREERETMENFVRKYYLQVPDSLSGVCEEFKEYLKENGDLLNKYQKGSANEVDMVRAAREYVMADTSYSLAPGRTPAGRDTVEYFLKEGKKGYCTYYATATAVLLRSAGVPARYVEGVYIDQEDLEKAAAEETEVDVPDRYAHAWIEVYTNQYGFVPVEVTPGAGEQDDYSQPPDKNSDKDDEPDSNLSSDAPSQDEKSDSDEAKEEPEQVTPTPSVTQEPEESMVFDDIEGNEDEPEQPDEAGAQSQNQKKILFLILEILGAVLAVILVLEIQRRVRRKVFVRKQKGMSPRKRIRLLYRHITPALVGRGVRYRQQSISEYQREMAEAMEMSMADLEEFAELLFHARFGPDDITESQMTSFWNAYEKVRSRAWQNAKLFRKIYYMYIMVL